MIRLALLAPASLHKAPRSSDMVRRLVFNPPGCKDGEFNWSMYVKNCRGQLAPKHLFKSLNTVSRGSFTGFKLDLQCVHSHIISIF